MTSNKSPVIEDVETNLRNTSESCPFLPSTHTPHPYSSTVQKNNDQESFNLSERGGTGNYSTRPNGNNESSNRHGHYTPGAPEEKGWRNYIGILLALLAGFVFTIGKIIVKHLKYHPFTLALYRLQGILVPSIFMVLYAQYVKKIPVFKPFTPLNQKEKIKKLCGILLRASMGCTALFLHFYALQYLQVADVAVLNSCKPVFVTIMAFILLGESFGIFPILMGVLTMVGVGVITRPPILTQQESFDTETLTGVMFAMSSVFVDTFVVVLIRYLREVHVSVMMLFLGFWGTIQSVISAHLVDELKLPQSGTDWALAAALAAVALVNQVAMNLALQYEQAGPVALTRTMDFIFAFLLQFIFMSVVPDVFSVSGAAIIILCVLLTAFRKWLNTLPETHPTRKRFWFVLK